MKSFKEITNNDAEAIEDAVLKATSGDENVRQERLQQQEIAREQLAEVRFRQGE